MSCFGFLRICFTHTHILCHHIKKQNQNFSRRPNTRETEHISFSQGPEKFMKRSTGTQRSFAWTVPQQGRYAVCCSPQTAHHGWAKGHFSRQTLLQWAEGCGSAALRTPSLMQWQEKKLHLNFQMHEMNRHGNLARYLYSELTWLGMAFSSARTFYFYFLFLNYGDSGPCETNPLTKLTPICHQEETRTLFMVGWEKHWFPLCFTGMIWKKAMRSVSKLIPHNKSFIPEQSATALWFCLILSNWCCVPESTKLKPSSRACEQQWAGMGALSLQWHSLTPSPCHTNREPSFRPTACPTFALSRRKQNLTCGPRGRGSALPRGALLWPPRQQPTWGPHCTLTKDSPANSQPIHSQRCSLRTLNYRGGGRRWWSSDPQVGSICWACGNCKKERQRTGISRCSLFRGQISKIEIYESQRAYSGTRSSLLT